MCIQMSKIRTNLPRAFDAVLTFPNVLTLQVIKLNPVKAIDCCDCAMIKGIYFRHSLG